MDEVERHGQSGAIEKHLLDLLSRHVLPPLAEVILRQAISGIMTRPRGLTEADLPVVLSALEEVVHHHIHGEIYRRFVTDLQTLRRTEEPIGQYRVVLRSNKDMVEARTVARRACHDLGLGSFAVQKVLTVVSELARNITMYAGVGTIEMTPERGERKKLRLVAIDRGPGIANLETVLGGRYQSKTGMGRGLLGVRQVAEHFAVQTSPQGTRVEVDLKL